MGFLRQGKAAAGQAAGSARRDPVIDIARFFCLTLVVLSHCMMVSPVLHADGTVTQENTLMEQRWFEPVLWALQVMPLFFVLGGITGLESWRRLRARGGTGVDYAQLRLLRLIRPATALLAVMFPGLFAAQLLGVHPQVVQLMATGAGMPLWFLAAYLAAQLSVPLLARLHEHAPWLTLAVLVAAVIAVDSLRGAFPLIASLNMVFVWCAVQQFGFFIADGFLAGRSSGWLVGLVAGSNLLLGLITGAGVYSGNMIVNLNPPNLCMLLLGLSQAATLQLLRPGVAWLARVRWVMWMVAAAGRRSMTIYLWHLPLLVAMTGLLLLSDFPKPAAGTAAWWWARPLVLLAVVVLLLPVLLLCGRLEERPTAAVHARGRAPAAVVTAGVVVFIPMLDAALNGLNVALLGGGAACFMLAVLLLGRVVEPSQPSPSRPETEAGQGRALPLPEAGLRANVES
ncbi:acyltransferase family protein [Arthrobacter celericrescens]|uniref:acyltransferase family protein n=1 Tax=Arthrobacter celericrescens TaxID=2320851 RepID=UPI000EA3244F|nr:acyltransferase [Arthrobacter celericrescens]